MADYQEIRLMDTTKEWAKRINDNFTKVEQDKVDKEFKTGKDNEYKELTDNNFTDAEKEKLSKVPEWVLDGGDEAPYVKTADIVDNTDTDNAKLPLSARQGKVLRELITKIETLLNSNDETLDELQEIVDYIKANKGLIDNILLSKVSKTDIVNDLLTNDAEKVLSAAQGYYIRTQLTLLKDELTSYSDDIQELQAKVALIENELDNSSGQSGSGSQVYSFTEEDSRWSTTANEDGEYTLTIPIKIDFTDTTVSYPMPLAVYRIISSTLYQVMATVAFNGENAILVLSDDKFEGMLVAMQVSYKLEG